MHGLKKDIEGIVNKVIDTAIEQGLNLGQISEQFENLSDHFKQTAKTATANLKVVK